MKQEGKGELGGGALCGRPGPLALPSRPTLCTLRHQGWEPEPAGAVPPAPGAALPLLHRCGH